MSQQSSPVELARELVRVLDWMEQTGTYHDRGSLDNMERLHAALRPAYEYFFGIFPVISSTTYPPFIWHPRIRERAGMLMAQLEANPDWTPATKRGIAQEFDWIHPRLLSHVLPLVREAQESGEASSWGRVSRDAAHFLEHEIRARMRFPDIKSRTALGAAAFKVEGSPLRVREDNEAQESWMHFVKGILGAFGNPGAHMLRKHSEQYAMGVVGAVSTVLTTLDEALGDPPEFE